MINPFEFKKYKHFRQREFAGNWVQTIIGTDAQENTDGDGWKSVKLKIEFNKKIYIPGDEMKIIIDIDRR